MDFRNFDLNLLPVMTTVARAGSVTRAAEALHLSQPAVTKRLNRLRRLFRDPLFVPNPSGVAATSTAKAIVDSVDRAVDSLRSVLDPPSIFDPARHRGTFRVYMTDAGQVTVLPGLMASAAREAPHAKLIVEGYSQTALRSFALQSGCADLAVGCLARISESWRSQLLLEDPYVGLVRKGHPEIGHRLSLEAFLRAPHLVYRPAGDDYHAQELFIDRCFLSTGIRRRVAVSLGHADGLAEVVARGQYLALIPRTLAQSCLQDGRCRTVTLPVDVPPVRIAQYWNERFHHDAAHRWLRNSLQCLFRQWPTVAAQ